MILIILLCSSFLLLLKMRNNSAGFCSKLHRMKWSAVWWLVLFVSLDMLSQNCVSEIGTCAACAKKCGENMSKCVHVFL